MGNENSIILYDLVKQEKIDEIIIEDQIFYIPFYKELYSMNNYMFSRGKKPEFYKLEKKNKITISELINMPFDNIYYSTNFCYDRNSFLLYGSAWDENKKTSILYTYDLIYDRFSQIESPVKSFYRTENKIEIKLKSKVDNLRVRKNCNLFSDVVAILKLGEEVQIIDIGKLDNIDDIKANWVQVKTKDQIIGWCFKGYLY